MEQNKAHVEKADSDQDGKVTLAEFTKYYNFMHERGSKNSADGKQMMCHPRYNIGTTAATAGTTTDNTAAFTKCNAFVTDATCDADTECEWNREFNPQNEWNTIIEKARQAGLKGTEHSVPKDKFVPIAVELFNSV